MVNQKERQKMGLELSSHVFIQYLDYATFPKLLRPSYSTCFQRPHLITWDSYHGVMKTTNLSNGMLACREMLDSTQYLARLQADIRSAAIFELIQNPSQALTLSAKKVQSSHLFLFLFFFFLIIYFWLSWVFVAVRGLFLVAVSGGYSSSRCSGFSLRWLLLLQSMGSTHTGFRSCGAWAQLLRGMWDLPGPGLEPVSPALAGGFLTTAPPGKPPSILKPKILGIFCRTCQ